MILELLMVVAPIAIAGAIACAAEIAFIRMRMKFDPTEGAK